MKRITLIQGSALVIAAIAVTSCQKEKVATVAPEVRVETTVVSPSEITGSRIFSGTVEESSGSTISFAAAGTVQSINVNSGDRVSRGQVLATLDGASLRHAYDIAKATLNEAQDAYNRMKQLHDANSLPDMKWVEIENTLAQAKSAEAIAAKALEDATLRSPISGYVSERFADIGQVVAPGVPVVKIVEISPVKVNISVPENEIADMTVGRTATFTISALPGQTFSGRISERGVTANPISRAYDVKIEAANPDQVLLPGMICDVTLDDGNNSAQAIVLPTSAVLLASDNTNFVWVKKDGKAARRTVKIGGMTDSGLIVTDGIAPGDSVITSGQQKVSTGTAVVAI